VFFPGTYRHAWGDARRCGSKLIENGDSIAAVKMLCGAPTLLERSFTVNRAPVETWTYNRGPDQFLVRIRFVENSDVVI
jgi:hypothetical protein